MKVPAHIKASITARRNAAHVFLNTDREISDWLKKKGISVDDCDINLGNESLFSPDESAERILEAIRKA